MSSKKCAKCGLVNFAKFETCQRCKSSLDKVSSIASKRIYQTPDKPKPFKSKSNKNNPKQSWIAKKLTTRCTKCGTGNNLSSYKFTLEWVSPVMTIGLFFIGPFIKLFQGDLVTIYTIHSKWCKKCIAAHKRAITFKRIAPFLSIVFIFVGIFSIIFFDEAFGPISIPTVLLLIIGGFVFAIGVLIYSNIYYKQTLPKVSKLKRDKVVLDIPGGIEVEFTAN